jgi:hypothetical protein
VPAIEVGGIIEEKLELLQLLLLHVEDRVRERIELARVVPMTMSDDDPNDIVGIEPYAFHLVR